MKALLGPHASVMSRLSFIATAFSKGTRGEEVAAALNRSPTWLSLFLKEHAPSLGGKNTMRRKNAAIDWLNRMSRGGEAAQALLSAVKAMNVDNDLIFMEGMTLDIAKCFGEADIRSIDDLAGLIPDDLVGFSEMMASGEWIHEKGICEDLGISQSLATELIMRARVIEGWIEPPRPDQKLAALANTACKGLLKDGRICGVEVRTGRRECLACWERSIPDSYAAIMSTAEYKHYLNQYEDLDDAEI